jgi:hypothetical protein
MLIFGMFFSIGGNPPVLIVNKIEHIEQQATMMFNIDECSINRLVQRLARIDIDDGRHHNGHRQHRKKPITIRQMLSLTSNDIQSSASSSYF